MDMKRDCCRSPSFSGRGSPVLPKKPSVSTVRGKGRKLFTADEIRRIIDAAGLQLRAMILLGINAGFGNADCGELPLSAVDLETGIIDYPARPKTGIARRCPLWPETEPSSAKAWRNARSRNGKRTPEVCS